MEGKMESVERRNLEKGPRTVVISPFDKKGIVCVWGGGL